MMDIREKLLAAFDIEYREHLEAIRALMVGFALRREGGSSGSGIAQLDEIFRRAHSLKGAARAVDLMPIEKIAHRLESLFSRVRAGQTKFDRDVVALVSRVLDSIEDWVAANAANQSPPPIEPIVAELDGVLAGEPVAAAPAVIETPPPPPAPDPVTPPEPAPVRTSEDSVRVKAVHLDRLLRTSNELLTETLNQRGVTDHLIEIDRGLVELERRWRRVRKAVVGSDEHAAGFDRHLDSIDQLLREVTRQARSSRRMQQRTGWTLRRLGGELQAEVRDARMVPAESVFAGFRKMVRDIARDSGKQVEVGVSGLEVEADRVVLQNLKDPVMHLLRNALAHGVEAPEERSAAGKPPAATIALTFQVTEGRLAVLVEDDGRGLDYAAIRAKAVESGLFNGEEAEALERQSLLDLIFDAGFSTRGGVDDLAGRGMGLSVVREAAAMMNGTVEVEQRQPGTRFRLSVPLTVSTQRLFLVGCHGHVYGFPTEGIDRLYRVAADSVKTVEGKSVVFLDDQQLPLLSLAHLLALGETSVKVKSNVVPLLVLKNGDRRVGVAVDDFLSIREGLVKDIGVPATRGTMVAGGMLLEDGSVALVLNPFEIVETFRKSGSIRVLTTVEKPAERHVPLILVVDDSLTTRTLEKSILEAHGYQVRLAFDGIEALTRMRSEHFDLVISDIQMPRLDGFGLLQAVKADPALAKVPVVLVTSLEAREDRERGLALGADAYVVKRKFDQKELLETIGQIL